MKSSHRSLKTAGAACLAAGLISTWDACPANASQSFSGEITPTLDLTSVYFIFAVGPCPPPVLQVYSKKISDFIPANTTTTFNFTLTSAPDNDPAQYYGFTVIGLYDAPNGGVTLAYNPGQAAKVLAESPTEGWVGTSLPQFFNGYGVLELPQPYNTTEASAAATLESGIYNGIPMDDARIDGLLDPYFCDFHIGELSSTPFTLLDFSGASAGGGGFVTEVVPEPATVSFLTAGALFFSAGRFWRRAKSQ